MFAHGYTKNEVVIRYVTTQHHEYFQPITLATLTQSEGMTTRELATLFDVGSTEELASWFGRLLKVHLVQSTGRTQATRYFVDLELLRDSGFNLPTTLKRIEPHRLKALIQEDRGATPLHPAWR